MTTSRERRPTVGVAIPLFNKGDFIARAIDSILAQTFQDFEVVVVDDGSTDSGREVVSAYRDPRVRLIRQENRGVSAARNRAIRELTAEVVAFLDADDEWMPEFLETVMRLREAFPSCSVFATNYLYRSAEGHDVRPKIVGLSPDGWEGVLENYFRISAHSDPPLHTSTVAVTREAINAIGGFCEDIPESSGGEDLLAWAQLAASYDIAYASRPLGIFWVQTFDSDRRVRIPQENDIVGTGLAQLLSSPDDKPPVGLRHYLSFWHRNRGYQYLRAGNSRAAFREVKSALRYNPLNFRAYGQGVLALTPSILRRRVYRFYHVVKMSRRKTKTSPSSLHDSDSKT